MDAPSLQTLAPDWLCNIETQWHQRCSHYPCHERYRMVDRPAYRIIMTKVHMKVFSLADARAQWYVIRLHQPGKHWWKKSILLLPGWETRGDEVLLTFREPHGPAVDLYQLGCTTNHWLWEQEPLRLVWQQLRHYPELAEGYVHKAHQQRAIWTILKEWWTKKAQEIQSFANKNGMHNFYDAV